MIEYGINTIGENAVIFDPVTIGFPSRQNIGKRDFNGVIIGNNAVIRSGTILYCDVLAGNSFSTGHNVMVREKTVIGDNVSLGTGVIIEGNCEIGSNSNLQSLVYIPTNSTGHNVMVREKTVIGDNVSLGTGVIIEGNCEIGSNSNLQSLVYIPTNSKIGNHVFIGPNAVLTNDKYPPHGGQNLSGPTISDYAAIGANVTILPGVHIGKGSLVAAGSVVTRDVPEKTLAIGSPARMKELPGGVVYS
ncbi:acyltransferase [Methanospirillum sp.]|uniref:acyltransferase n=1 Tax=Methanospirillum sp. TaxID=45200 RepID=UPI0035A15F78